MAAGVVFLAAASVLVLEILSLRLVAPYLGLTLQTSTAVIGVALSAIATGTWLGGRAADLVPPRRVLGPLLVLGGGLTTLVVPVVRWAGASVRGGDVSAVLLLATLAVFVPAALLSAVTPMVVKLQLAHVAHTGRVVGRLSGVGTLGAIAATFGTGFLLVAALPTSVILLAVGALVAVVGAALTATLGVRRSGSGPSALAGPVALLLAGSGATLLAPDPCRLETAYHCARVLVDPARPGGRTLVLDTLRHSYVDLADPTYLEFTYLRAVAAAVDAAYDPPRPLRALHLGAGGVTLPRYLAATRPGTRSRVLEVDPGVVALDRAELGLRTGAELQVDIQDARVGLAQEPEGGRDLVVGDAFGGLAVPWHLTTRETVADVRRVLAPGGLYAVNVIDFPPLDFARAEVATLRAVFAHVAVVATPETLAGRAGGNLVLLAAATPLPVDRLAALLAERVPELRVTADPAVLDAFVGSARVLTDDFAPVDQLLTPPPG
ncbi:MAG: fused MFS/spermidine synthase [Actinomycetota bacterium]